MAELTSFRDRRYAEGILREIRHLSKGRKIRIVHVCGTHEDTISSHGLRTLLPPEISLIAGPGCPVCVCAAQDVDMIVELARQGHIITTFGDMLKVPSSDSSLAKERTNGADVRVVYGINDAIDIAKKNPDHNVIFMAVGFETTAPTIAIEVLRTPPPNFFLLTSLKIIPPAMELLANMEEIAVDGFITPGHVSTIIGSKVYEPIAKKHHIPCVVAGFEPLDVLEAIRMILLQIRDGRAESENEYTRVVRPDGNPVAQKVLNDAFQIKDAHWRGLGTIKNSGLFLKDEFADFDARKNFEFPPIESVDILPGCQCHRVILGMIDPTDCALFGTRCTPDEPYGPCMVGHEGTCRIRYLNRTI